MTEEEYFRKNYPDYCYGDNLLSPYWDLFQYGVEFGERQSEKKIKELKKRLVFARAEFQRQYKENEELKSELTKKADTNHSLVEQMANLESTFRICEQNADTYYDQRTKAKDLIENIIRVTWGEGWNYSLDWKVKAEQFIKEIEK